MKFLGETNMNLKSYAIIGAIVVVAVFIVIKMTKFEGTVKDGATVADPKQVVLKPSFTTKKEA